MRAAAPADVPSDLLISYLDLRKAVGWIGIALPIVVSIGGAVIDRTILQPTISDYYYTVMRDWFVGSLCAIGVFMMSYRGYDWRDRAAGKFAFVFAIAAALFPTAGKEATPLGDAIGTVHAISATGLFSTLAVFCRLFRKSNQPRPTKQKLQRNLIYAVCGATILVCIVLIGVYKIFLNRTWVGLKPVFWLETVAVLAFGASWLVKGETILKDKPG